MNKFKIFLISFCLLSGTAIAQSGASMHMDRLSENYQQIKKDTWDYIKKASRGRNAGKIEKRRLELVTTLRSSKSAASRVKPFEGDATLKDAVVSYLNVSISVLNDDFAEIVNLEKIAEDSYDDMEAYLLLKERVNARMDSSEIALQTAQKLFASKNNIRLVEAEQSKLGKKLSNASEVISYSNKVFLIYFKSNWYEQKMIQAISAGNVSDAEQYRQSLESVSEEGKIAAQEMESFRGDRSVKVACLNVLNFYHQEATSYATKMIDFYVKKEELEKVLNDFQQKKKKDITREDVEKYNSSVDEFNKLVEEYNKNNEALNKRRSNLTNEWNKTRQKFYDKFV